MKGKTMNKSELNLEGFVLLFFKDRDMKTIMKLNPNCLCFSEDYNISRSGSWFAQFSSWSRCFAISSWSWFRSRSWTTRIPNNNQKIEI